MQIIVAILGFLAVGVLVTTFRTAIGAVLGTVVVAFTIYLLVRDSNNKNHDNLSPDLAAQDPPIREARSGAKPWIAIIGFGFGGLLLWNAIEPRESLRMVPYGEIVALIPEELRGRYEACQLPGEHPPYLRCSIVESEWQVAFLAAQDRAMRSPR